VDLELGVAPATGFTDLTAANPSFATQALFSC
jgi:hypothetical protein